MLTNKRLFNVGDTIFVLLTSSSNPNVLIPVKGVVKSIKHDLKNPRYLIKIVKFFDTWPFLKKYFLDNNYTHTFTDRPRPCRVRGVNSVDQIMAKIENPEEENRYYIVVDSIMSFKFHHEMLDAFEKIQDFVIHKRLRELMEFQTRTYYKGKYKIDTQNAWYVNARNIIDGNADDDEYKKIVNNF